MNKPATDEDEIEASKAPLLDHLIELRKRIIQRIQAFDERMTIIMIRPKMIIAPYSRV